MQVKKQQDKDEALVKSICQQDEMCPKPVQIQQKKHMGYIIQKDKISSIALSISDILLKFFLRD